MTSPYRRVLRTPGALAFSGAGLLARLPISMIGLGIVLLVSNRTGSYSHAGVLSGRLHRLATVSSRCRSPASSTAAASPVLGYAASRLGRRPGAVRAGGRERLGGPGCRTSSPPSPGAALPNVGAAVRARWSHVLEDRRLLDTAFAVEAVNDEVVFVVGPTLVTLLASAIDPVAGLAAAGLASLVGTWALVAQRRTEPPRHQPDRPRRGADARCPGDASPRWSPVG